MSDERVERRLAAILMADVVGYSRAMEVNEEGTLTRLKALRRELFNPIVAAHRGRIVKTTGDGALVEFASSVDALQCAVKLQRTLANRADSEPAEGALQMRIGVNIGEIIIDGEDIYGTGINVAARLETLAEPGGICISSRVMEQVEQAVDVGFESLGPQSVKNIERPVNTFRILLDPKCAGKVISATAAADGVKTPKWIWTAAAVSIIFSAGFGLWAYHSRPDIEPIGAEETNLSLTDKPSIAVLPFDNVSGNDDEVYFAEGLAHDLITNLAAIESVRVIAQASSFLFRDTLKTPQEIGRELSAQFLLNGNVRRAGGELRINVSLIEARSGTVSWARRFEGGADDVFSLQDQLVDNVASQLEVALSPRESRTINQRTTDDPVAFDAYLRGMREIAERRKLAADSVNAAETAFEQAIKIDPDFALAYAGLAWVKWIRSETIIHSVGDENEAFRLAERSLELQTNALAYRVLAKKHYSVLTSFIQYKRDPFRAAELLESARRLRPNDPDVLADLATVLPLAGKPAEALGFIKTAMALNPNHPDWYFAASSLAYLFSGMTERAVVDLKKWTQALPTQSPSHLFTAVAYGLLGDKAAAQKAFNRFDALESNARVSFRFVEFKWPMAEREKMIFLRGLKAAGVD